jgi:YfiH family protein
VAANRRRLVTELDLAAVVFLGQVHGVRVTTVADLPSPGAPDVPGADAAVTGVAGVGLAVLAADCVPVLLADPAAGVVGAAHAGRVGAAGGVVPATVAAMAALGARAEALEVLLGPAVCGACYEVPAAMRAEVDAALPGSATRTRRGTPGLDLRAGLHRQLAALGVARVGADPRCTVEDPDLYSHRRDGRTGRLAAVTWLDPGPRPRP